jgi:ABC-type cobalamin/Fe3+-siderophores transport system ATPase subunit
MANKINITNLRGISDLAFEIPGQGVHLLTGANGSGKTSVLACLRRIGDSNAFPRHFSGAQQNTQLDSLSGAAVEYEVNGNTVTYAYAGERWVPRPRSQAGLLGNLGYSSVIYVGATADRVTPTAAEFRTIRPAPAPQALKDAANEILDTTRFSDLRQLRVARRGGRGPVALLLPTGQVQGRTTYSTERTFSLGELCVLKLARELLASRNNALVLIDELELALHPMAQVRLFRFLERLAAQKSLTVVFSTHSVTLLKRVPRRQLLLLERQGGRVSCIKGCYPTYALGAIAFDEEVHPDSVIYVEDVAAAQVTEALAQLVLAQRFQNNEQFKPTIQVVPVGPFDAVVRFLPRSMALLPERVLAHALLDADVQQETIAAWTVAGNHIALSEYQRLGEKVQFLPFTPEVGLVEHLLANAPDAQQKIRATFTNNQLRIDPTTFEILPPAGAPQRDAAKRIVRSLARSLAGRVVNRSPEDITRVLFQHFAAAYFASHRQPVMELMTPLTIG